nr:hypothetical protein [Rhodococcus tukisamuensis]
MIVDCGECEVRGAACADCLVPVLLGLPGVRGAAASAQAGHPVRISIEQDERVAMEVLADAGLVPRLRLVVSGDLQQTTRSLSCRDKGVT